MPTALITGATSGIGLELASLAAQDRHDLVLVARQRERLESVGRGLAEEYGVRVSVLPKDLSDPSTPPQIGRDLAARGIAVDVLVNNAGFGVYGLFAETEIDRELEMIQVNVVALTHLTKLILAGMLARRLGRILNVASTAAFQPGPLMAVYYATKAYVLSFSEALANETAGTGVTVTTLCPGPTPTGFAERAGSLRNQESLPITRIDVRSHHRIDRAREARIEAIRKDRFDHGALQNPVFLAGREGMDGRFFRRRYCRMGISRRFTIHPLAAIAERNIGSIQRLIVPLFSVQFLPRLLRL